MLITALALACFAQEHPSQLAPATRDHQTEGAAQVPLPRRALPADTAFVVHFDARSFLASSWWQALGSAPEIVSALEGSDELRMVREQFGVDPFRDLLSVTVLGRDEKGGGAAVLVRTTSAVDGAVDTLRGMGTYSVSDQGGLALDRWGDGTDGVYASYCATPTGDRIAILGRTRTDVAGIVQAADGDRPNLALAPAPAIAATPRDGTILYVEVGLPLGKLLQGSPVAKAAEGVERITLELGERAGNIFVEAKLRAKDRKQARRVADIVNGARAFVSNLGLMEQLPLAVQDVYDGLLAEVQGSDVRLGFELAARDVAYLLEELRDELGAALR